MKKYLIMIMFAFIAQVSQATEPDDMTSQCEQYGAYQNQDGEWLSCEYEEDATDEDPEHGETPDDYEQSEQY